MSPQQKKLFWLQDLKEDFVAHEENWKLIFDALEPVGTTSTITKMIKSLYPLRDLPHVN